MWILLCEHYESNKLLSADLREALLSTLLLQVDHKVEDCLTAEHFVTHVNTHHDCWLVLQDGGGVAWPDGQSDKEDTIIIFLLLGKLFFHHWRLPIY